MWKDSMTRRTPEHRDENLAAECIPRHPLRWLLPVVRAVQSVWFWVISSHMFFFPNFVSVS